MALGAWFAEVMVTSQILTIFRAFSNAEAVLPKVTNYAKPFS